MIIGMDSQDGLFYTGTIIWMGAIMIWFFGGVIIRHVTGIPLKFGYGGWYVPRSRRRK